MVYMNMKEFGLTKNERLHHDKAIRRLFGDGQSGFAYPFRYYYLCGEQVEGASEAVGDCVQTAEASSVCGNNSFPVSILFSVPKKMFKRANKRNLLKRRMREAYRLNKSLLTGSASERGLHIEIAIIYSVNDELNYKVVENGIRKILKTIRQSL